MGNKYKNGKRKLETKRQFESGERELFESENLKNGDSLKLGIFKRYIFNTIASNSCLVYIPLSLR